MKEVIQAKNQSENQAPVTKHEMGFFKTLIFALILAGIVRSLFFEPFHIPSSSMKPGLLIGDYIFVSKYSYGYSRYSFPFGFKIKFFEGRVWQSAPKRGDVVVFRFPKNTAVSYIKRVIGLPGDRVQVRDGVVYINDQRVEKKFYGIFSDEERGAKVEINQFLEILPEGRPVKTLDQSSYMPQDNTGIYEVPSGHYFLMGDNRDNSQDSRFLDEVGFVPEENLIGRARIIFFSASKPVWQIWNWIDSIRTDRIFKKIE